VDHYISIEALLQLRNLLHDVSLEHNRVVPVGFIEGRRDDVLGHAVEFVCELVLHGWPGRGEALICHTSQQQRFAVERLVELELFALRPAVELEGPARMLEAFTSSRGLHHTIERDEFSDDDPAHLYPPSR